MTFQEKLDRIVKKNSSLVCVGLDSNVEKIPGKNSQFLFNKSIIEATNDLVCSYKLNTAFYESIGYDGIKFLKMTCDYLRTKYPEIPIIIDAKRGDVGSTNQGYVQFVFTYLGSDAVTVNPYLGEEAIRPFLKEKDKGIIILCRTSNKGAGEFQDLKVGKTPIYKIVAENVSRKWNKNKNCLLVIGATYHDELKEVRKIVGSDMTFLVPGIGAQGGDLRATLKAGLNKKGSGLIINSSRGIIFAQNPRNEAEKLREQINRFRISK
ncbi:orotidine-5'-phosphate decarboxylase [Candidatus Roizmanbacteria bacterium]|nr:orotidine-5'-phosphate decarboxylase [Candidatus Roizmanbacteria bacterium]